MNSFLTPIFRNKQTTIVSTLVFVALTAFFLVASKSGIGLYDEGLMLTGAFRILNGDIPSRDFYVVYGPGQFYVLAGLFKVFGLNLLVARIYDSAVFSAIAFLSFFLLKRNYPRWYSLCGSLCVVAVLVRYQLDLYPINPVLMIILATAAFLIPLLAKRSSALSYISVSTGIALILLFRYDLSIIAFAAFGAPIIIVKLINYRALKMNFSELLRKTGLIFFVLAIVPCIAAALLAIAGILIPAFQDILTYNSTNYVEMRSLPFPGITTLKVSPIKFIVIYFPIFVSAFSLVTITLTSLPINKLNNKETAQRLIQLLVFTSLTCFLFVKGWVRTSGYQMLLANINATLLLFMCAYELGFFLASDKLKTKAIVKYSVQVVTWLLSVALFTYMLKLDYKTRPLYREYKELEFHEEFPSLSFFRYSPHRVQTAVYVIKNTDVNERIHSATGRHDKIFANDASVYFVTQRMPASRWHHYEPGVQNSQKVQQEIIHDLETKGVSLIIRNLRWDNKKEPNKSAESSNVFVLDQYLEKNFHEVASYGRQQVFYLNN